MPKVSYHLGDLHAILKKEKPSSVCLVTTRKVAKKLPWALRQIDIPRGRTIFVPDGEQAKEWHILGKLLEDISRLEIDRSGLIIILGGGTVGDLTGFAASIYLRGIRCIQIPTTLVAQVDSAHGGKTGINFRGFKNQVGTIHEPVAVIVDSRFIASLPPAQIVNGLGEIIKCGLIRDTSILAILKKEHRSSLPRSKRLSSLITKTIDVKSYYTRDDIQDTGRRSMLNFDHTAGHAIELKYKLNHGHAVILGMLQELAFTESLGLTVPEVRQDLLMLLQRLDIPHEKRHEISLYAVRHDKKVSGTNIMLPVVQKEGRSKLVTMDLSVLKGLFK